MTEQDRGQPPLQFQRYNFNYNSTYPDFFKFPRVSEKNFIHISAWLHHFCQLLVERKLLDIIFH